MHGVSLSIGSAHGMYEPSLAMMDRLRQEWPFRWYSEHLQFQIILDANGAAVNTGTPFPLPPTKEAADLVAARAASIQDRYGVPFLLENPVHYLPDLPADAEVGDEFGLMERIVALSGCGQLLDLHNLYCNAINFGFDAIHRLACPTMPCCSARDCQIYFVPPPTLKRNYGQACRSPTPRPR